MCPTLLIPAAVFQLAAGVAAQPAAPDPVEVMRGADRAVREVAALEFRAEYEGVGTLATRSPLVRGEMRVARAAEGDRLGWRFAAIGERLDRQGPPAEGEAEGGEMPSAMGEAAFHMAYNGAVVRSVRQKARQVAEASADSADQVLGDGAGWLLGWLIRWDELVGRPFAEEARTPQVAYEGMATVKGVPCHVVQVDYSEFPGMEELDAWWYIGAEDSLPRRLESHYYGSAGDGFGIVTISSLKVVGAIPDEGFSLTVPEGFEVVEVREPEPVAAAEPAGFPQLLKVGDPAPDWVLKDPAGREHRLADYRGKVVLLDFWGTWCPPCRMAMPGLQALHERFQGKPVAILGLNVNDPPGAAEKYMKQEGFTYGLLLNAEPVARNYGVSGFPTFFVIGVDGKVIHRAIGFDPAGDEKIAKVIEEHLAKQPG